MTIFVDSLTCHLVSVLVPAVGSIKKSSPSYLLLGHTDFFCEVNIHCLCVFKQYQKYIFTCFLGNSPLVKLMFKSYHNLNFYLTYVSCWFKILSLVCVGIVLIVLLMVVSFVT